MVSCNSQLFTLLMKVVVIILALLIAAASCTRARSHKREGSMSSVNPKVIERYIEHLDKQRYNLTWHPSIKKLAKTIHNDPSIRYNWQHGISISQNLKTKNYTGKDVLDLLNAILNEGPKFTNVTKGVQNQEETFGDLVGFPINVVFIHLMQTENGRALFSNSKFNRALKRVLKAYGKMLKSPTSLTYMNNGTYGWFSPKAVSDAVDYSLFYCDPTKPHYGFKNWNEWFLREFKPNARPIGQGTPNKKINKDDVIVSSCESTPISDPIQPVTNVQASDSFWLKDNKYSLVDMFGKRGVRKGYGALFVGGTVFQAFLSAMKYHHWHAPVSGTVVDVYKIPGKYFLDQSQFHDVFDPSSPDMSQSFISAVAARMVFIIKADNPKIGYVGLIYIGMAECSGVVNVVKKQSLKHDGHVKKGDRIGHFAFGGSSYTMVFQKNAKLTFAEDLYSTGKRGSKRARPIQLNSFLAYVSDESQAENIVIN